MEQRAELEAGMEGRFWPDIKVSFCFEIAENINVPHSLKLYRKGNYFLSKMTLHDVFNEREAGKFPIFYKSPFSNIIYPPNISLAEFQKTLSNCPGGFHILGDKSKLQFNERVQSYLIKSGKNSPMLYGSDTFQKVNHHQNTTLFQQGISSLRINQPEGGTSNYNNLIDDLYQKKEGINPSFFVKT